MALKQGKTSEKKGEYGLFSYIPQNKLLIYTSKNKVKKYFAFSIIETNSYIEILPILNKFLKCGKLNYYSIQFNTKNNGSPHLILNFKGSSKKEIIHNFYELYGGINDENIPLTFQKKERLEKIFDIFSNELKLNLENKPIPIVHKDHLKITENANTTIINIYKLNLKKIKIKNCSLEDVLNGFTDCNILGNFILNVKINDLGVLILTGNLVTFSFDKDPPNLTKKLNNFFQTEIVELILMKSSNAGEYLSKLLWRLPFFESDFYWKDSHHLFDSDELYNFSNLSDLISQIRYSLNKYKIETIEIRDNLLLINNKVLLMLISKLDLNTLKDFIAQYYGKYTIFLLFIQEQEYAELISQDYVKNLRGLEILDKNAFLDLSLEVFH